MPVSMEQAVDNPMSFDGVQGGGGSVRAKKSLGGISASPDSPDDVIPQAGGATSTIDPFDNWIVLLCMVPLGILFGTLAGIVNSYPTTLFSLHYGLDVTVVTNISLGIGLNSVTSLALTTLVSKISDGIKSKYGRRKPFVIVGLSVQYVGCLILSVPGAGRPSTYALQVAIGILGCTIGSALWETAFSSWLIESVKCQAVYAKLNAIKQLFYIIAMVFTIVVGAAGNQPHLPLALASLMMVVSIPLLMFLIPNPVLRVAPPQPPLVPSIRTCVRTAEFRTILFNTTAIYIGISLAQEFFILVFITSFDFSTMAKVNQAIQITGVSIPIVSILVLPLTVYAVGRFEKIKMYQVLSVFLWIFTLLACAGQMGGLIAYDPGTDVTDSQYMALYYVYIAAMVAIIAGVTIPITFIVGLFVRDLVLYDNFVNNIDRENVYQQALGVPVSVVVTVIAGFFKAMIYATGFRQSGEKGPNDDYIAAQYSWNEGTLIQILCYILIVVSIATAVALYTLKDYPLTTAIAEQLTKIVKARSEVKAADMANDGADTRRDSVIERKKEEAEMQVFIDEVNLWNSLSRIEVDHIVSSRTVNGKNLGLSDIRLRNSAGVFVAAPLAIGAVLWGSVVQLMKGGEWATMGITLFAIPTFYFYYEFTRFSEMNKLGMLSPDDLKEQAEAAKASNDKYQVTVQSLLDENGIVIIDQNQEDSGDGSLPTRSGSTSGPSLAKPLPVDTLSGYKRQWAFMLAIVVVGVVLALA